MESQEEAATAVEYALLAGLIAVAVAATVGLLGQAVVGVFEDLRNLMGW